MKIPRIILAGATSGVGKTSITCGIIHGMRKKGYSVQPFKVGPDYIDPSYLTSISSNETTNLDAWLMGKKDLIKSFVSNSTSSISVIEGVMGFYDGARGDSNFASTYHIATILDTPVLLVLDASKTARSIAATALGYVKFQKKSHIVGIILNKVGSKKHEVMCRQALSSLNLPILGCIPKNKQSLDSRHLGLIPIHEEKTSKTKLQNIAKFIADFLDIEQIVKISKNITSLPNIKTDKNKKATSTIAVALDESFNFYYRDNINALKREGSKIKFFSPIHDSKIPTCDGIYIGGGFPEILGSSLEKNQKIKRIIKNFAENNMPIYAECGGLMYLTKSIDYGNKQYKMIGLFDAETSMTKKMILNYTKGSFATNSVLANKGTKLKGHEFHYSKLNSVSKDSRFAYDLDIGCGIKNQKDGLMEYSTLASYGHFYFDSSHYAKNFVKKCTIFSRR